MSDWLACCVEMPTVGVHQTAGQYFEVDRGWRRFQHFDGARWGAIGMTVQEAEAFAATPTEYPPNYWRVPAQEPTKEGTA